MEKYSFKLNYDLYEDNIHEVSNINDLVAIKNVEKKTKHKSILSVGIRHKSRCKKKKKAKEVIKAKVEYLFGFVLKIFNKELYKKKSVKSLISFYYNIIWLVQYFKVVELVSDRQIGELNDCCGELSRSVEFYL